jgi:predicted RND superfamily exporter protein
MISRFAAFWAGVVYRHAVIILMLGVIITYFAVKSTMNISVSTRLEGLMPQGAESVKTLNNALKKTGSFASIQIVASSTDPATTLKFIEDVKTEIDKEDWVQSSQFFEDVEVLEQHKLLLLSLEELETLEADINEAYPTIVAKQLSEIMDAEVTITLRGEDLVGNSNKELDQSRIDEIQGQVSSTPQTERRFVSDDELTMVLVVWPKPGLESLTDAKNMVIASNAAIAKVDPSAFDDELAAGVAGRIANKVAQFDAIMHDLKTGLMVSISLIAILIIFAYRSIAAIPAIFIPLAIGIIWTLGMTAVTVGGLNLITVFLTLILFGLGIDFGIHNFSRFREERRGGKKTLEALTIVMQKTGAASLIAALTTSLAFFSLMLTEFRAFTEFGAIAGMGIGFTFISMYSIFPALIVVMERLGWNARKIPKAYWVRMGTNNSLDPLKHTKLIGRAAILVLIFITIFAPQIKFERNIKNLEAQRPADLTIATEAVGKVFTDGHDRAIVVVETQEEVVAIDKYFKGLIKEDTETPTIKKIGSLLDFVPDQAQQEKRLEVIGRLGERAEALQSFDPSKYQATKRYLTIEDLNVLDLPDALRRTVLAKQFYDDAAGFIVNGKQYYSASESFIFVEMIALMKSDAVKAIALVTLTTAFLVFYFIRTWRGTLVVLIPPLLGVLLTIGIMGAFGPTLSIMNMVILPSLIGIAVDNAIHIFHRFEHEGPDADIANIMNTTGRAAVLTTLTTLIGFGGMVTASMGGLRSMGTLAIIGFISCLVMTWVLLPVLMQIYRERMELREAHRAKS